MWVSRAPVPEVERIAERFVHDVWNDHRRESAYELIHSDLPGLNGIGPSATIDWHVDRRRSFSDLAYELVEMVSQEDRVALHWRASGHQDGAFGPIAPTGKPVTYDGVSFLRIREGQIVEVWSTNDLYGLVTQLGAQLRPAGIQET
jgi:predicted ester cyclase